MLIVYRPPSKTTGKGISPFAPETDTNSGFFVGLNNTLVLKLCGK